MSSDLLPFVQRSKWEFQMNSLPAFPIEEYNLYLLIASEYLSMIYSRSIEPLLEGGCVGLVL